ncbi:MAG: 4-hydroxy-tetrahydrodipicolinate reductase [Gammaproteobacteria bacterium]
MQVAVFGATGRMGQALLRLIALADDLQLAGAVTEAGDSALGRDAGQAAGLPVCGIVLTDKPAQALAAADVAIDFTLPAAAGANASACAAAHVPLVMGTTGLDGAGEAALQSAAGQIAVLYGRNMSLGVNLLTELVRLAAGALGEEYDIEILEAHHRHKVDAPSGTALQLGEAAADGRQRPIDEVAVYARHGQTGARERGTIGFASLRGGSLAGDHSVLLAADDEVIQLSHHAVNRDVFARGALQAARWLVDRGPGLYGMRQVLGLAD